MIGDEGIEDLLVAPIVDDSRFVVFTVRSDNNGNQRLLQSVVSQVPSHLLNKVTSFPVVKWETGARLDKFEQPSCVDSMPPHLRSLTVINSKHAGGSAGGQVYFNILSPLLKAFGVRHVYVATDSPETICAHAQSFSSSATVVIIGGDTSVHEFVNFLPPSTGTDLRLSIIPAGTGNALMSSLGVTSPLTAVQRLFLHKEFYPLSSFEVTFPPGARGLNSPVPERTSYQALVVASWGFHAALVAESDSQEMRKYGSERFGIAAGQLISNVDQTYFGEISGVQKSIASPISYLLFTTVTNLEATFPISPHSNPPSSGKLFCVAVPAVANSDLMDIMRKVYDHSAHIEDPRVIYQQITGECYVEVGRKNVQDDMRRWCVDGCIIQTPPGIVTIHRPTTNYNGWNLFINK